jgi:ADP-ribose pyrophosphatase
MVSESFSLVRAHGLTKISDGGGVDGENIIVHRVALPDLPRFVQSKRDEGCAVDVKLLMLPGMLF